MSSRDVPEPWARLLADAGLVDPRNGIPSMSRLAEESGVHASTISAMMYGDRRTRAESIDKIAATIASRSTIDDPDDVRAMIRRWVGQALGEPGRFEPHPDADLLTPPERKAVNDLIRLLAASKREGGEHGGDTAATSKPRHIESLADVAPRAFVLWAVAALDEARQPVDPRIRRLRHEIAHSTGPAAPQVSAAVLRQLENQLRGIPTTPALTVVAAYDTGPGEAEPGAPEDEQP